MSRVNETEYQNAGQLSDAALEELQLRQQPFVGATEGEWYYDDITAEQLEDIKHALMSGDDLLLILGPQGSGKSTLLSQLAADSGQRIQCFSVRGTQRFSTENLFAGMLEAFKRTPPAELHAMLDELVPCLQGMMGQNTLGAIVLDDANDIPEHELTKLLSSMLYLNGDDDTLLRVALAAPEEFENNIPMLLPQGADLPYSSLTIDAFDAQRSQQYLEFRLNQAGSFEEFPFSEKEMVQINEAAHGRPALLHAVAAEHINMRDANYVPELPPELASTKSSLLGGSTLKYLLGALALIMIVFGLLWKKPSTPSVNDDRYKVVESRKIGSDDNAASTVDDNATELQIVASENTAGAEQQPITSASNNNAASSAPSSNTQASNNTSADSDSAEASAEAEAAARLAEEKAQREVQAKAAEEAAAEEAKQLAEKKAAEEKAAADAAAKAAADAAAAKKAAEEAALNSELANLESPNWILVQDPKLFTVQMSAATDRASVEAFLARNKLSAPNSIFSFERSDVTWYALVHGLYPSIEAARTEIEKMPASARSNQPWIRAVGRIQQALKDQ